MESGKGGRELKSFKRKKRETPPIVLEALRGLQTNKQGSRFLWRKHLSLILSFVWKFSGF